MDSPDALGYVFRTQRKESVVVSISRPAVGVSLALAIAGSASAARVVLKDGREFECPVRSSDSGYVLTLAGVDVSVPRGDVATVFDDESYVPQTDDEKKWLEKGYVRFEGRWVTKSQRERALEEKRRAKEARLADFQKHVHWDPPWEKKTPLFLFRTNVSPERLDHYVDLFEAFYKEFNQEFGITISQAQAKKKIPIQIYSDEELFRQQTGEGGQTVGIFVPEKETLHLYELAEDPAETQTVLFHEGTHMLVYLANPNFRFSTWFNEGIAEYYGTTTFTSGKIVAGALNEPRLIEMKEALDAKKTVKLEDLLLMAQESFDSSTYAHAWSLIHFLMNSKYKAGLRQYYRALSGSQGVKYDTVYGGPTGTTFVIKDKDQIDYFKHFVGVRDLAALDSEWKAYVKNLLPKIGPRGWLERGISELESEKVEEAEASFDRAAELGSTDTRLYWYRAVVKVMRNKSDEAIADLEKLVVVRPLDASARAFYGQTLVFTSKRDEGLSQLRLAALLDPDDPRIAKELREVEKGEKKDG
jgi:tetratricopeptide (TPR) repeat protein